MGPWLVALAIVVSSLIGGAAIAQPPAMTVYKSPYCGCCGDWVEHARAAGFDVEVHDVDDVFPMKRLAGVPDELASCHTTTVGGYVIEGHVPASVVLHLLETRPDVDGIAVPGMPAGSPGMEGASPEPPVPYHVYTFDDGRPQSLYATIEP